jgi:hypothetical protein
MISQTFENGIDPHGSHSQVQQIGNRLIQPVEISDIVAVAVGIGDRKNMIKYFRTPVVPLKGSRDSGIYAG